MLTVGAVESRILVLRRFKKSVEEITCFEERKQSVSSHIMETGYVLGSSIMIRISPATPLHRG
jgi:hypothetical protein